MPHEIRIPVRLHCSVTETDFDDFVSWTSDFLGPARRSHLYTTKAAILAAIERERAEIVAAHPEIGDLALTFVESSHRNPFPEAF